MADNYTCAKCGKPSGMFGHSHKNGNFSCQPDGAPLAAAERPKPGTTIVGDIEVLDMSFMEKQSVKCGHVHTLKNGIGVLTVECQEPSGHSGNHGGMGCEWTNRGLVDIVAEAPAAVEVVSEKYKFKPSVHPWFAVHIGDVCLFSLEDETHRLNAELQKQQYADLATLQTKCDDLQKTVDVAADVIGIKRAYNSEDLREQIASKVQEIRSNRIDELQAEIERLKLIHNPMCDSLDINADGIKKPCNCQAGELARKAERIQSLESTIKDLQDKVVELDSVKEIVKSDWCNAHKYHQILEVLKPPTPQTSAPAPDQPLTNSGHFFGIDPGDPKGDVHVTTVRPNPNFKEPSQDAGAGAIEKLLDEINGMFHDCHVHLLTGPIAVAELRRLVGEQSQRLGRAEQLLTWIQGRNVGSIIEKNIDEFLAKPA